MTDPALLQQLAREFTAPAEQYARTRDSVALERLRALRLAAVSLLLGISEPIGPVTDSIDRIANACVTSGLRRNPRTAVEDEQFARCLELAAGNAGPPAIAALLLASHAFELPTVPSIGGIAPALRPLWLKLLFETPAAFDRSGDSERFVGYLQQLCCRLQEHFAQATQPQDDVVQAFFSNMLFIQAYLNELNVRELMRVRASLIERILETRGSVLDQLRVLRPHRQRPRIGFIQLELSGGTETVFLAAHIERLDRSRYEVRLYCGSEPNGPIGTLCRASAGSFVRLSQNLQEAVAQLRREALDIAVFCTNLTIYPHFAAQLAAHRVAPIQVVTGASPVTSGLRNMDALIQGESNETEDSQAHYTEQLVRMRGAADCYPFQYALGSDAAPPVSRAAFEIPDDALVYLATANYYKIVPELSRTWIDILARVPNSRLVLMPYNPHWSRNYPWVPLVLRLLRQATEAGVSPRRLRIQAAAPDLPQLHALMGLADVYLDSFPYTGACSFFDALRVGLPIVTRRGQVNRSRHGSAILEQEGLADWVAADEAGYIHRAVELGTSPELRRTDRVRLAKARQVGFKLCDTADFAARLMPVLDGLLEQWDRHVASMHRLEPARLAERIGALAREIGARRFSLTESDLIAQVVLPYLGSAGSRLIGVGVGVGSTIKPFLEQGWQVVSFEPGVDVDFIRIGASADFVEWQAIDWARVCPRLIMTGLGEPVREHNNGSIETGLGRMRDSGYRACVVGLSNESGWPQGRTRLRGIGIDAVPWDTHGVPLLLGILFFRDADRDFLPSVCDWLAQAQRSEVPPLGEAAVAV